MGSNINFNNLGNEGEPPGGDGSGKTPTSGWGNFPLARQSSIYSLTFDEFQNTLSGVGKDFGSMNMDELLKNIWSAEETQCLSTASIGAASAVGQGGGGNLQRQGSLTLPRTLSTKTVDEVWKDLAKEFNDIGDGSNNNVPQTQPTLGEMTLEEFLFRAGVVREDADAQPTTLGVVGGGVIFGDLAQSSNNNGFGITFQQPNMMESNNQINLQPTILPLNVNGVRTSQEQHQPLQQQPRQQPIFPKQPGISYGNAQLGSPRIGGGVLGLGLGESGMMSNSALGGGGGIGGLIGSPANGLANSNGDTSSVSPVPYVFNGGFRGRKSGSSVDKVVERRQRRMIKNRESAARSRARKQAYTMELEQEIAKLKEENEELRKKQEEMIEMQKNQAMEMMNEQAGPRKRLRRTQTGMW